MSPSDTSGGAEDPLGPPAGAGLDDAAGDTDVPGGSSADDGSSTDPEATDVAEGDVLGAPTAEQLIEDLERASRERDESRGERDEYLDALRRNQADFENFRKRIMKQQADDVARAAESLVDKLLPVLDACDGAIHHGAAEVEPIFAALLGTLEKEGLERINPVGEEFDPNRHEAVMHDPAGEGDDKIVVTDVMRPGYGWKGRILRPAMVKVRG